ncbi:MAG: sugar phosphate isomerase/epimerase [Clostridiales bacterium]|nr:sugar phosphate isomerase/epimerase [Clostridiales bacterium]
MKTGVSTASLFLRKNNEEALPLLEELGVKTAEVFLTSFIEYGRPFADTLLQNKGSVNVNSVHILNTQFEPQLFNAHPRVRGDAYYWLEKVLQSAQILGAPYYTFHGTARIKRWSRSGESDNFPAMIDGFQNVIAACEKYGVQLCLENVEWATYNRVGVFERLHKALPTLRGVLDIKQARISNYPYQEYLAEMGQSLAYVHVSDTDEWGKMCLPGKGVFDYDTLIKRLQDVGFDGALLIEVYKDNYETETELKTAVEYLDEKLYKHNCLR